MAETVSAYVVADMFLRALGAPSTPAMKRAVAIWLRFESGGRITGNNPWNLHGGQPCREADRYCTGPQYRTHPGQIGNRYAGPGDQNVAVFGTLQQGTAASARNLIRLSPSYGYGKVIAEARQGDALGFLNALQQSSWSAGHYGYSKLVNAFKGSFNYNTKMTLNPVGGGSTGPTPSPTPGGGGGGGGGGLPGDPGSADTVPEIIQLIQNITGKGANDVLTQADLEKFARAWGGSHWQVIYNEVLAPFVGKTNRELATELEKGGLEIPVVSDIGRIADTFNDIVGQAGDIFLFVLGVGIGGILTVVGANMLLTTTGPTKPLQAELVLPEGGTIHSHLSRK